MQSQNKKSPDWLLAGRSGQLGDKHLSVCNNNNTTKVYSQKATKFDSQKTPQNGVPLGNTGSNVSKLSKLPSKWALLNRVQTLLEGTNYAVLSCQKPIGQVQVLRGSEGAYFGGLITCKSVWLCPVCNRRIAAERGDMIRQSAGSGFEMLMLTLTLQHTKGDTLDDLLGALKSATRDLKMGGFWQRLKQEHDIKAYVTSYEITYGQHGWHPHVHMVLYFGHPPDIDAIWSDLVCRWVRVVQKVGKYASKNHALDLTPAEAEEAADYVTKYRGGISYELTGANNKGKTFWDLVWQNKKSLVREYASATFGLKSLTWSHGAKNVLGIKDPDPDTDPPDVLADIPDQTWEIVRTQAIQGFVLELAEIDPKGLQGIIDKIGDNTHKQG